MLTRREIIELCLTFPGAYEDYPFGEDWTLIRHSLGRRSFAIIYERNGDLCVNLKCEPMQAEFWRKVYTGVTPGYHMNKTHWNTAVIGSDLPKEELAEMIRDSYELTRAAPQKKT